MLEESNHAAAIIPRLSLRPEKYLCLIMELLQKGESVYQWGFFEQPIWRKPPSSQSSPVARVPGARQCAGLWLHLELIDSM